MGDSENSQNEQETVVRCDICGVYEGTFNQVKGHKPRCREKADRFRDLPAEPDDGGETNYARVEGAEPIPESVTESNAPETEPVVVAEPAATRERKTPDRKERVPLGVRRLKLAAPARPGFHRRWINDGWKHDPSRISDAEAGGYVLVEGVAPRVVGSNDNSTGITARLMEIPQELYDEDQAAKAREIDEKEKTINKGSGIPGDNQYVPDGAANRG